MSQLNFSAHQRGKYEKKRQTILVLLVINTSSFFLVIKKRRGRFLVFTWRVLAVSALVISSVLIGAPLDTLTDKWNIIITQTSILLQAHEFTMTNDEIPQWVCGFQSECPSAFPTARFSMCNTWILSCLFPNHDVTYIHIHLFYSNRHCVVNRRH